MASSRGSTRSRSAGPENDYIVTGGLKPGDR
jgi:hypothetical protein